MSAATMNEMERLRRERDEARAERDAMAANVERLREGLHQALIHWGAHCTDEDGTAYAECEKRCDEAPATSLARLRGEVRRQVAEEWELALPRLKAEWQAEALAAYAVNVSESYLSTEMLCAEDVHDGLLNAAANLRRRAKGPANGHN